MGVAPVLTRSGLGPQVSNRDVLGYLNLFIDILGQPLISKVILFSMEVQRGVTAAAAALQQQRGSQARR